MNQQRFEEGTKQLYAWLTEGKAKIDALLTEIKPLVSEPFSLNLSEGEVLLLAYGNPFCCDTCECDRCSIRRKAIAALKSATETAEATS